MIIQISKFITVSFGIFLIFVGFIMLFYPKSAQSILRKFASTNLINYLEITSRLIVGIALIVISDFSKSQIPFKVLGWFMAITAFILFLVPRKLHHSFSEKSADFLKPKYFQFISPFSFLFGGLILYSLN